MASGALPTGLTGVPCDDWFMSAEDESQDSFDEMMRSIAREAQRTLDRVVQRLDLDDITQIVDGEADHARELVGDAMGWLRGLAEQLGRDDASWMPGSTVAVTDEESLSSGGPRPRDLPTTQQGTALAALDSGRWTVEPGGQKLVVRGEGSGPGDASGIVDELRARDWLAADGALTLTGRHALGRWLDASQ